MRKIVIVLSVLAFVLNGCSQTTKKQIIKDVDTLKNEDVVVQSSDIESYDVSMLDSSNRAVLDTLLCVDYSDATFGEYEAIIDFNLEESIELAEENVRKMFLGNKDKVEIKSYYDEEVVDTLTAEEYLKDRAFYLKDTVFSNENWTAIILEEIDYGSDWSAHSDKYLITIDNNQDLISKYRIAYYGRFGTYTCDCEEFEDEDEEGNIVTYENCGRCPWYTGRDGCINKDLTIKREGSVENEAFIDNDGYIVEIK